MVAPEQEEVFRVFDLVGQQKADRFQGLAPAVDVVSQEQVVGFWWEASVFKQAQEVSVLAVDIPFAYEMRHTTDLYWSLQFEEHRLPQENFSTSDAELFDFIFCQINCLALPCPLALKEFLYDLSLIM